MSRMIGARFVYDIFDYYADSFPIPTFARGFLKRSESFVIEAADATILPSEARVAQIGRAKPRRLVIIHNSPDLSSLHNDIGPGPARTIEMERLRVVYVGILADGRMLRELVEIVSRHSELHLTIAGFGPLEAEVADAASRSRNIDFLGRVSHEEAMRLSRQADVLTALYDPVIPNHRFAAPNKFYEAIGLGKTLIVARGTGIDTTVVEARLGIAIAWSQRELERALLAVSKDPRIRRKAAQNGPALYASEYSWEEMRRRLALLYADLIPLRGGA